VKHQPITPGPLTGSFETTLVRTKGNMSNGAEREWLVDVEYRIYPGCKATRLTPAEPDSFDLTDAELDQLTEEAEADAAGMAGDYEDYLYEQHCDRQLMADWRGSAVS